MARPSRCRRICAEPAYDGFLPTGIGAGEEVTMTVDEYEVIRLLDLEKLTQEQCARQIGVARSTVTNIYESAREILADCLVHGKRLTIAGGHYRLCSGSGDCFRSSGCDRQSAAQRIPVCPEKGEKEMRIAVCNENGQIFQHFGHTASFLVYDEESGKIVRKTELGTDGSGHGALAGLLQQLQADCLICGGIGGGAQQALAQAGIRLYGGVSGSCDEAVQALLEGTLTFSAAATCDHHHEHGENCGKADCGTHGCHHK